jgi:hypothetical protein
MQSTVLVTINIRKQFYQIVKSRSAHVHFFFVSLGGVLHPSGFYTIISHMYIFYYFLKYFYYVFQYYANNFFINFITNFLFNICRLQ